MTAIKSPRTSRLAIAATVFGVAAGIAEVVVGTSSWIGNKNDPTTLGWVTIGLALVVVVAAVLAERVDSPGARFATGLVILVAAAVGLTTAGLAWIPAAGTASIAGVLAVRAAHRQRSIRGLIAEFWPAALLIVLASIYLAFGIVAGGAYAFLAVAGAAAVGIALILRHRSRLGATIVLIGGAVPFASVAVWTVVIPFTAVLILALGLPLVHSSSRVARVVPRS